MQSWNCCTHFWNPYKLQQSRDIYPCPCLCPCPCPCPCPSVLAPVPLANYVHVSSLLFHGLFTVTRVTHTECSNIIYLQVKDAVADTKDTMMDMLHELQEFIVEQKHQWLILEGDGKIYEISQSLKFEYSEELKWVIPFRGDWHMLKNYQIALIKP